jgi:hypothetical protein
MIPVSGAYDVDSRQHKRPVEHSSDSPSTSSESGDHFGDTTASPTDTDTAGGLRLPKKRPRLQYRDHIDSFQSDDSWRTENTATSASALTEAAVDQSGSAQLRTSSSGQWVLRRNRSNVSVSSTRTEGSDHDEETAVHSNRSPSFASSPASTPRSSRPASLIFVAENSSDAESSQHYQQQQEQPQPQPQLQPQHYQGDGDGLQEQMESLTSRVENWSLTNIRALRRNNVFEQDSSSAAASTQARRQVRAAKRDVMRVLRRSNNSLSSSIMSSCSNTE